MDIDDKENVPLVHNVIEKYVQWKGKQQIVLPDFDHHSKEVRHGNDMQRVTKIAYEIRTSPANINV